MEIFKKKEEISHDEKINQSQVYELITGEELSWQAIIYDLIKTEQLDPWDIDIGVLADKYVSVIQEMEEADFFISSKVLLACSLLLRLKSDILLNKHIQSLDEILYGRKDESRYEPERIEIDDDELPLLVPKTPIPRSRKVTLNELMDALNQAIETENRRIRKEVKKKQAEKSALIILPRTNHVPLKLRVKSVFSAICNYLKHPESIKMKYSDLAPSREEKISSFLPVLHLTNEQKIYLQQEEHYGEIYMTLEKLEEEMMDLIKEIQEEEQKFSGNLEN